MGGQKEETADKVREGKRPERMVQQAIWGMIPHNRLGRKVFRKLKVFTGKDHKHDAQMPEKLDI